MNVEPDGTKLLEAGLLRPRCVPTWLEPSLACARLSAGDSEQEPLHAVCPPRALPPSMPSASRAAVQLSSISFQVIRLSTQRRPQGLGVGPSSLGLGPAVWTQSASRPLSTPLAPFSSCCCLCLGHPAQPLTQMPLISVSLCPHLLRRLCGGRKNPGLGIKQNPTQTPSSPFSWAGRS